MSTEADNPTPAFRSYLRYGFQGVILGIIATAAVFFFTLKEDTWEHFGDFDWRYAPVVLVMIVVAWLCNGGRIWINARALGHKLKYRQSISVSLSTEFGIAASPAGMGGTALRLFLLKRAHVPLTTSASMLAADVAMDLAFFALLTPVAIWFILRDQEWFAMLGKLDGWEFGLAALGILIGVILMVAFFQTGLWSKVIHELACATSYGRRHRWPSRFRFFRYELHRSMRRTWLITRFLFRKRRSHLLLNFFFASTQWLCRYSALPIILLAFGALKNPFPLLFVQGFMFLFAMLVVLPGGGGGVEVATAFILQNFVPLPIVGVVMILWRIATYYLYLLGGGAVFFYVCGHMDKVFPPKPQT